MSKILFFKIYFIPYSDKVYIIHIIFCMPIMNDVSYIY